LKERNIACSFVEAGYDSPSFEKAWAPRRSDEGNERIGAVDLIGMHFAAPRWSGPRRPALQTTHLYIL